MSWTPCRSFGTMQADSAKDLEWYAVYTLLLFLVWIRLRSATSYYTLYTHNNGLIPLTKSRQGICWYFREKGVVYLLFCGLKPQLHLAITFCHVDTNKPYFSTNMSLKSYQKRLKFFVIFPNNLILVPSYMQKVMANNNCASLTIEQ